MKRNYLALLACVGLLAASAWTAPAEAFGLSGVGLRVGATDPEGGDGTLSGGANLEFEETGSRFHMAPGVLFWSNEGLTDINPNFDVYYHFAPASRISPYAGAGAAVHMYSSDGPGDPGTDLGLNLFGGVLFPAGSSRFFVEGRYSATDISQTSFFGGVTLPLNH